MAGLIGYLDNGQLLSGSENEKAHGPIEFIQEYAVGGEASEYDGALVNICYALEANGKDCPNFPEAGDTGTFNEKMSVLGENLAELASLQNVFTLKYPACPQGIRVLVDNVAVTQFSLVNDTTLVLGPGAVGNEGSTVDVVYDPLPCNS